MLKSAASRVAAAHEQQVMHDLVDLWVDAAMDAMAQFTLTDDYLSHALFAAGVKADAVNAEIGGTKTAGVGDYVTALGGKVLRWGWKTLTEPFKKAWELITSAQARREVKQWLYRVLARETSETRMLWKVIRAVAVGGEVTHEEMHEAVHQFFDILKTAIVMGVLVHHFGPVLIHNPMEILLMIASPADEIAGILLDHPMKVASRAVLGRAFGLLPTAFYEVV